MKTISRMGLAIIMAAGFLATIGQTEAFAGERQVTFIVPVRVTGFFQAHSSAQIDCAIYRAGSTVLKGGGRSIVPTPARGGNVNIRQNIRVVVRLSTVAGRSPFGGFRKGDPYRCSFATANFGPSRTSVLSVSGTL